MFLEKNLASLPERAAIGSFEDIPFDGYDMLFDWTKQELRELGQRWAESKGPMAGPGYDSYGKAIPLWEYEGCFDQIIEIFSFSRAMATTALGVFTDHHTRRMRVDHLDRTNFRAYTDALGDHWSFLSEKFPIEKLQHLTLHIEPWAAENCDSHDLHALTAALPELHTAFTGLKTLRFEINWMRNLTGSLINNLPHQSKLLYHLQKDVYTLALQLCLATEHVPHVMLMSGEEVVFSGDWTVDEPVIAGALLLLNVRPIGLPGDTVPVGPIGRLWDWIDEYTRATRSTDPETGAPVVEMEVFPRRLRSFSSGDEGVVKGTA